MNVCICISKGALNEVWATRVDYFTRKNWLNGSALVKAAMSKCHMSILHSPGYVLDLVLVYHGILLGDLTAWPTEYAVFAREGPHY